MLSLSCGGILQTDLAAGRPLAPFLTITVARGGYVALVPLDADKASSVTAFIEWLRARGTGLAIAR